MLADKCELGRAATQTTFWVLKPSHSTTLGNTSRRVNFIILRADAQFFGDQSFHVV